MEDRLFTKRATVKNLNRYIKRVDVLIPPFDKLQEYESIASYVFDLVCNFDINVYDNSNDFNRQTDNIVNKQFSENSDLFAKNQKKRVCVERPVQK